jgi:hypothetical protein
MQHSIAINPLLTYYLILPICAALGVLRVASEGRGGQCFFFLGQTSHLVVGAGRSTTPQMCKLMHMPG